MTLYGALRGFGYVARDVWGAVLNAAEPRSRTGYVDHLSELLAGREAETEVAEPDEAQTDCGLGGQSEYMAFVKDGQIIAVERRDDLPSGIQFDRVQSMICELQEAATEVTSAAPAADTDAAADGPALESPSGAGPHQLTSGDLRAAALAAREKAKTCDPADAPGWAALAHRFIQAAHAMTLAAMHETNPEK